jgi:hypothetical protein
LVEWEEEEGLFRGGRTQEEQESFLGGGAVSGESDMFESDKSGVLPFLRDSKSHFDCLCGVDFNLQCTHLRSLHYWASASSTHGPDSPPTRPG